MKDNPITWARITWENGDTTDTSINGTVGEVWDYYSKNKFNFGDTDANPKDLMLSAVSVEFPEVNLVLTNRGTHTRFSF